VRKAEINRKTLETNISLQLNLDGEGKFSGTSGIGFFDHMLELFTKHSGMDLHLQAEGDLEVDYHHTVEDIGIALGQAIKEALADKKGICRYGFMYLPMDEALARVCLDLSGRPFLVYNAQFWTSQVGNFDVELAEEFLRAVVNNAAITLHVEVLYGRNTHHILEAIFKGFGQALKKAVSIDSTAKGVPSTKGQL
jgi:imidazoleglycerol-phosphate dehydratase